MKDILKITIGVTLGVCISELIIVPRIKKSIAEKKVKSIISKPFNFLFGKREKVKEK